MQNTSRMRDESSHKKRTFINLPFDRSPIGNSVKLTLQQTFDKDCDEIGNDVIRI